MKHAVLACALIVTILGSGYVAAQEWRAVRLANAASSAAVTLGVGGKAPGFLSFTSSRQLLLICANTFTPQRSRLLPQSILARELENCGAIADFAHSWWPTDAMPHLIRALISRERGAYVDFIDSLDASHRLAPFEGWQAKRRFSELSNAYLGIRNPQIQRRVESAIQREVVSLLHSQFGAETLGTHYLRRNELRPLLRHVAHLAEPKLQRRFLNQVQVRLAADDR